MITCIGTLSKGVIMCCDPGRERACTTDIWSLIREKLHDIIAQIIGSQPRFLPQDVTTPAREHKVLLARAATDEVDGDGGS